jgi:hypothetical protein
MYEQEETGIGSQASWQDQGPGQASESVTTQSFPDVTSASHPLIPRAPQLTPVVKSLHVWIVIVLLALILVVSSVGLVLQIMPTSMRGGGASFIPDQSFQGGQPQNFERPDTGVTS